MELCFAVVISNNTTRATHTVEAHSDGSEILWFFGTHNWALEVCNFWNCFAKHKPQEQQIKPPGQQPEASEQRARQGKARQGTLEASFGVLGSPAASQGPVLVPRSRHKRCQGPGASQKLLREGVGYLQECKTRGWAKCPIPIAKPWRTIAKKKTLQNHCKPQQKPRQNHGTP